MNKLVFGMLLSSLVIAGISACGSVDPVHVSSPVEPVDCGVPSESDAGGSTGGSTGGTSSGNTPGSDGGSSADASCPCHHNDAGVPVTPPPPPVCVPKSLHEVCGSHRCNTVDDGCGHKVLCGTEAACNSCKVSYTICNNTCEDHKCNYDDACTTCHEVCTTTVGMCDSERTVCHQTCATHDCDGLNKCHSQCGSDLECCYSNVRL